MGSKGDLWVDVSSLPTAYPSSWGISHLDGAADVSDIRILLADIAFELRDIVAAALAGRSDLTVIGESTGEVELLLLAARADVVILGSSSEKRAAAIERLLDEYSKLGILAVDGDCRSGRLYQLRPYMEAVDTVTSDALVAAIRRAACSNDRWSEPSADHDSLAIDDGNSL